MSQETKDQLFPIRIKKTQEIEWTHSPCLPLHTNKNILQYMFAIL